MKESEFIQLLNLYLDHEISGADAVRLEAEVQNNPARRKIYQQYCRMQKACKLLASDFQTDTAEGAAAGDRKIIAFDPAAAEAEAKRRRAGMLYTIGGVAAAAACVAVIFSNRVGSNPAPASQAAASFAVAPAAAAPAQAQVADLPAGPRALGSAARNQQPKLVADPLLLTPASQTAATVVSTNNANDQLQWLANLQIVPLQPHVPAEDLRFDVRPATLRPEARVLGGNRAPAETTVEMTAFRFVK